MTTTNYIEMTRRLSDIYRDIMSIEDLSVASTTMPEDSRDEILEAALQTKEALAVLAKAVHSAEFNSTQEA